MQGTPARAVTHAPQCSKVSSVSTSPQRYSLALSRRTGRRRANRQFSRWRWLLFIVRAHRAAGAGPHPRLVAGQSPVAPDNWRMDTTNKFMQQKGDTFFFVGIFVGTFPFFGPSTEGNSIPSQATTHAFDQRKPVKAPKNPAVNATAGFFCWCFCGLPLPPHRPSKLRATSSFMISEVPP